MSGTDQHDDSESDGLHHVRNNAKESQVEQELEYETGLTQRLEGRRRKICESALEGDTCCY